MLRLTFKHVCLLANGMLIQFGAKTPIFVFELSLVVFTEWFCAEIATSWLQIAVEMVMALLCSEACSLSDSFLAPCEH